MLSFPAALLVAGDNTITCTHGFAAAAGTGPGWDTLVLEVDEGTTPAVARLTASLTRVHPDRSGHAWAVAVRNRGKGPAHDVNVTAVRDRKGAAVPVTGTDPGPFPTPVCAVLGAGEATTYGIEVRTGEPLAVSQRRRGTHENQVRGSR
ncbi:MAG: hypothetical protein ACR2LI_03480 [Propionibacteriaceae bacterium]